MVIISDMGHILSKGIHLYILVYFVDWSCLANQILASIKICRYTECDQYQF